MKRVLLILVAVWLSTPAATAGAREPDRLRIGVTLHPYYSWTANIVGDAADVVPVLPEGADPHGYQPKPEDVERIADLDILVINGLGHDDFVDSLLAAAATDLLVVDMNARTPAVAALGIQAGDALNSHTFLSITNAVQQVGLLAEALGRAHPERADRYRSNAAVYVRRLRGLLRQGLAGLQTVPRDGLALAAVHDGYGYLLAELGLPLAAVVQPRHGIDPSPRQLADTIDQIRSAGVDVLFVEADYVPAFAEAVRAETGVAIARLSHIARGPYRADMFEREMAANLQAIVQALRPGP